MHTLRALSEQLHGILEEELTALPASLPQAAPKF